MSESSCNKVRVCIISEKVMPYRCALYRQLAAHPQIDLKVLFLDRWGAEERFDPTMGVKYSWGEEVLDGIPHEFLANQGHFSVTYTGADRTRQEERLGALGGALYYLRTYFGVFTPVLAKRMYSEPFDAVIVENYSSISSALGAFAARLSGKRVFLRGEAALRENVPVLMRAFKQLYLRAIFKVYNGFMFSCRTNREYYEHYGANPAKMTFVPSAVDENFFSLVNALSDRATLRKKLGFKDDDVVFLGVGRLVLRKNWAEAIHGICKAATSNARIKLILVGDGPEKTSLQELACGSVYFSGFKAQHEILEYYQVADVIVQTSTYDPSPKVLNEALGFGLPIVAADTVGTAGDVCIDQENGFVYPVGNLELLIEAISRLANSQELRDAFGAKSLKLSKHWSLAAGVDNIAYAVKQDAS